MTRIGQLSLVLTLLSMACGLRSPFGRSGNPTSAAGGATAAGTSGSGVGASGGLSSPGTAGAGASSSGSGTGAAAANGTGSGNVNGGPTNPTTGAGGSSGSSGLDSGSSPDVAGDERDGGDRASPVTGDGGLSTTILFPDGGIITYPDDPAIPSPRSTHLDPTGDSDAGTGGRPGQDLSVYTTDGCGEPAPCFITMSILTVSGRIYNAAFSSSYPKDNCARDILDEDGDGNKDTVFIGDSFRSMPSDECSFGSPLLSVALFVDLNDVALRSRAVYQAWKSPDGFRSEWHIANARAADNGSYYPLPGAISFLNFWNQPYSEGRALGELQVPLINNDTGTLAVGYVAFDVIFH
jgi:hypothetical protein